MPISVRKCDRRARRDYRLNACIAKRPFVYPDDPFVDILSAVTKHLVEIDDEKLAKARELAGTPTIKATVDRALDELIALRRRLALLEDLRDPQTCSTSATTRTSSEPRDGADRARRRRHQRAHSPATARSRRARRSGDRRGPPPHVRDGPSGGNARAYRAGHAGGSRSRTFGNCPNFRSPGETWLRAEEVQGLLVSRSHHTAVKVGDLVIAAVAETAGLPVIHYDRDFDLIAEVTGQDARWVVPRGSID